MKILKILRRTSHDCFWYKNSNAYRNYSASTGQSGDVPWRSSKGPKMQDLQGPAEASQVTNIKNYGLWFLDKVVF